MGKKSKKNKDQPNSACQQNRDTGNQTVGARKSDENIAEVTLNMNKRTDNGGSSSEMLHKNSIQQNAAETKSMSVKNENEVSSENNSDLQNKHKALEANKKLQKQLNDKCFADIGESKAKLSKLEESKNEVSSENNSDLQNKYRALKANNKKIEKNLIERNELVEKYSAENGELKAKLSKLEERCHEMDKRLTDALKEIEYLKQTNAVACAATDTFKTVPMDIDEQKSNAYKQEEQKSTNDIRREEMEFNTNGSGMQRRNEKPSQTMARGSTDKQNLSTTLNADAASWEDTASSVNQYVGPDSSKNQQSTAKNNWYDDDPMDVTAEESSLCDRKWGAMGSSDPGSSASAVGKSSQQNYPAADQAEQVKKSDCGTAYQYTGNNGSKPVRSGWDHNYKQEEHRETPGGRMEQSRDSGHERRPGPARSDIQLHGQNAHFGRGHRARNNEHDVRKNHQPLRGDQGKEQPRGPGHEGGPWRARNDDQLREQNAYIGREHRGRNNEHNVLNHQQLRGDQGMEQPRDGRQGPARNCGQFPGQNAYGANTGDRGRDMYKRDRMGGRRVVKEVLGDLFTASKDNSLAHCVAEDLRMGSGIAVSFRQMFKRVDELLDQRKRQGQVAILEDEGRYIYYLVTKPVSTGKPTMDTLERSLRAMHEHMIENKVTKVSMPRIGCGLDRLRWDSVMDLIENIFSGMDVEITVYNYNEGHGKHKSKERSQSGNSDKMNKKKNKKSEKRKTKLNNKKRSH